MTSEKLAAFRAKGLLLDPKFDRLAEIGDKKKKGQEKDKSITIKFVSCSTDDKNYNLTFEVSAKNLKSNKAKIYVGENEVFRSEEAITKNVGINPNGKQKITASFSKDKEKEFSNSILEGDFEYIAEISCDGLSAKSPEFKLKCTKIVIPKQKTCFCNRDFTEVELKDIVIELRKTTYYDKKTIFTYHSNKIFHRNNLTKEEYKSEIIIEDDRTFEKLTFVLNKAFNEYKINTCIRKISFLAQMYIETAFYTSTIELTKQVKSYDPFRGRGFIQLTHKGNEDSRTKNATSYLGYKKHSGLDVLKDPSIISKSLHYSADSAGWFWTKGVRKNDGYLINLNDKCGDSENEFKEITRLIKGSTNEFKERYEAFKELLKIMKYEKCTNK